MAVIGVGRSGSLVAEALASAGVHALALIDPDVLEPHNLAEMALVRVADIGRPKAEAVAERLRARMPACRIEAIAQAIAAPGARRVAAAHPWLWQCVDNDAARLGGALVAAAYHRVLVDVGTGIELDGPRRRLGADIRLILPGDGCLLCRGGLGDPHGAWTAWLAGRTSGAGTAPPRRAGSLRSLNQVATGLALRLAEDAVGERLSRSAWLRLEFDPSGTPRILDMRPAAVADCPLFARAGSGDELFATGPESR